MVDQLIDVIEPVHVGATGDITPEARAALEEMRELNGKTTAFQDIAIAGRINDASSLTLTALNAWRPASNALDYGIDNTGKQNVSDQLNEIMQNLPGLWFPAGTYLIDKTVYVGDCKISADPGAVFCASQAIDVMFDFNGNAKDSNNAYLLDGGVYDGKNIAGTPIKLETTLDNNVCVSNVIVRNFKKIGIECNTHAARICNAYIVNPATPNPDTIGLSASFDSQYSDIKIFRCGIGIRCNGFNQFTNIYIWAGNKQTTYTSYGFKSDEGNATAVLSNVYLDCCGIGFSGFNDIMADTIFYFSNPNDAPVESVPQTIFDKCNMLIGNIYSKPARMINFGGYTSDTPIRHEEGARILNEDYINDLGNVHNSFYALHRERTTTVGRSINRWEKGKALRLFSCYETRMILDVFNLAWGDSPLYNVYAESTTPAGYGYKHTNDITYITLWIDKTGPNSFDIWARAERNITFTTPIARFGLDAKVIAVDYKNQLNTAGEVIGTLPNTAKQITITTI